MAVTAPAAPARPTPSTLARIEAYVAEELRKARIPGGAVAVVFGDEPVLLHGVGQTARRSGEPVTPGTLFQIGSLTKGLTAMAILQLRDRGLIDLEAPVQRYLPWFRVADPDASARITVRHLIDQVSGLPNGAWKVGFDRPPLREAVERLRTVKLVAPPGAKWMYSNMNYSILGLLIETVTGQSYADYVKANILTPLVMTSTFLEPMDRQGRAWARPHVDQIGGMMEIAVTDDPWAAPAGIGPSSNVIDLARWAACHLGFGQVLDAASLHESHAGTEDAGIKDGHYGRGWFNMNFHGSRLVFNHGGTAGHSSVLCIMPDEGLGVAALMNCTVGLSMKLGLNIVRLLKGQEPDVPDVFPDFGKLFAGVVSTLGILGALLLGTLAAGAALGWTVPAWLGWTLAVPAAFLWALPAALKRNFMMPLPFPMNVGPGGWPLNLVLAWWAFLLGLTGWALYGIVL